MNARGVTVRFSDRLQHAALRVGLTVVSLVCSLVLRAGTATTTAHAQQVIPCDQFNSQNYSVVTAAPKYQAMTPHIVNLQSNLDGAAIQLGLLRPRVPAGTRVPVIVDASPYYNPLQTMDWPECRPFLTHNFVPQGYAVALVPIRGTADNGGCMNLFGPKERADLNQVITWLGTRPWSNGNVGMIGLSYDGSTPWEVASFGNPHLKTIVPMEGVPDVFRLLFGAGTPDWRGPGTLNDVYYLESILFYLNGRSARNTLEVTGCPEYLRGNAAAAYSTETGTTDPFGYWAAREYVNRIIENYRGSVFLVQGLQDWNVNPAQQFPLIPDLEQRGVYVKELIGQWFHDYPDAVSPPDLRTDYANMVLAWFDRWLYGDQTAALGPKVEVEDSTGQWRTATEWPPENSPGCLAANVPEAPAVPLLLASLVLTLPAAILLRRRRGARVGGSVVVVLLSVCATGAAAARPTPAQAAETSCSSVFWLTPDNRLDPQPAPGSGQFTLDTGPTQLQDPSGSVQLPPSFQAECVQPVCAAFATAPQPATFRFAGMPDVHISVTPTGPGGEVSVFLYDQSSTGYTRVGWGQVDLRFPDGWGSGPVTPQSGVPMVADFPLQPVDTLIPAGDRLVMILTETNTYNRLPSAPNYPVTLSAGGTASSLTLQSVSPSPDQFFAPPHLQEACCTG